MISEARSRNKSFPWGWVALAASLLGLFAAGRALPIEPWLRAFNEWVGGVGAWSIVIFIVVYVIATVLLVPGSALTVGAGICLRPWMGTTRCLARFHHRSGTRVSH